MNKEPRNPGRGRAGTETKDPTSRRALRNIQIVSEQHQIILNENYQLKQHIWAIKENSSLRVSHVIGYVLDWLDLEAKRTKGNNYTHFE